MKKLFFAVALCLGLSFSVFHSIASETAIISRVSSCSEDVHVRSTVRLYYGEECLTLYTNGSFSLTGGDSFRITGTYTIADGWVLLRINGEELPCKAKQNGGYVQNVSYNGHVYWAR